MMADKRKAPSTTSNGISSSSQSGTSLIKRQRQENGQDGNSLQLAVSSSSGSNSKGLIRTVKRTSSLSSPIIALNGAHSGEILDVKFSPDGQSIAAASTDKSICESMHR